jgi:hypothetical protein
MLRRPSRHDFLSVLTVVCAAAALHGPAIVGGRVLLPADIVLLMRPWMPMAHEQFPDFRFAQNQLLGPIFEYYSWRHYARERIRAGEVPLWNPLEMGGNVLLANSQSAVLYPPNVLLYLLPLWMGINMATLLHSAVTGLLMLGFLRALGLRHSAAVAGALTWMLCGCLIVWTEFQTPTATLCWLPGALWALERAIQPGVARSGQLKASAAAAVALALTLTAGHPQFAFYVVLSAALYALLRAPRIALYVIPASVLVAGCLGAATLLPVAEASRINHRRSSNGFQQSVKLRLPPWHLTSVLLPNVRGNPRDYVDIKDGVAVPGHPYIGPYDFTEYCFYVGIPALILSIMGVLWCWRNRAAMALCVLGAIGLALALGTPLAAPFFYLVPGYSQFHAPARALCMVHFALAALAAYGMDAVLRRRDEAQVGSGGTAVGVAAGVGALAVLAWPLTGLQIPAVLASDWMAYAASGIRHAVLFAAATGLALWLALKPAAVENETPRMRKGKEGAARGADHPRRPSSDRLPAIALAALPALCALDLLVWGGGYNPATDPAMLNAEPERASVPAPQPWERAVAFENPDLGIKSLIVPNFNAVVGYREVQGADSVHTRRYHRAMEAVAEALSPRRPAFPDANTVRLPTGHHPLLDALNVTCATTCPPAGPPAPHYVRESEGQLTVWRNPHALGPGRLVTQTVSVKNVEEAVAMLTLPGHDLRRTAVVEGPSPVPVADDTSARPGRVTVKSFSPHRIVYDVVSPGPALLVTSEVAYPGWKATMTASAGLVQEHAARVVVADGVLRAVPVPGGSSVVVFRYEPTSFRVGLFITLSISMVFVAVIACWAVASPARRYAQGVQ